MESAERFHTFEFSRKDKRLPALMEIESGYKREQLALRNGQDKPQIWIAYKGIIYEVTASRLWRDGKHYEHWAGQDLTDELKDAPHMEDVLKKFSVVGRLI